MVAQTIVVFLLGMKVLILKRVQVGNFDGVNTRSGVVARQVMQLYDFLFQLKHRQCWCHL